MNTVKLDSAVALTKRQQKLLKRARPRQKREKAVKHVVVVEPAKETLVHGEYEKKVVLHSESATQTETTINRRSHVIDKWIDEGGLGFEGGAVTAIRNCQFFWERMKGNKLTASYGERISGGLEGMDPSDALDMMARFKRPIPAPYWNIFENVVRNRQPAGVAGSDLAKNTTQSIASARAVVGFVASKIAEDQGY